MVIINEENRNKTKRKKTILDEGGYKDKLIIIIYNVCVCVFNLFLKIASSRFNIQNIEEMNT